MNGAMEWTPESSLQEETLGNISVYDWHPQWHTGACSVYRVYNLTWEHSVMSGFPPALPHQMKRKRNTEVFTADLSIAPEAKVYWSLHRGSQWHLTHSHHCREPYWLDCLQVLDFMERGIKSCTHHLDQFGKCHIYFCPWTDRLVRCTFAIFTVFLNLWSS